MKKVNQLFILLVTFFSCLNSYSQNDPSSERRKPRLIPSKPPTILKTQEGYEFKNVIFTDDDKEALLNIYKGKDNDFRLAERKENEVTVYGKGKIENVSIIEKSVDSQKMKGYNAVVSKTIGTDWFTKNAVVWSIANLSDKEKIKLDKILSKYQSSKSTSATKN